MLCCPPLHAGRCMPALLGAVPALHAGVPGCVRLCGRMLSVLIARGGSWLVGARRGPIATRQDACLITDVCAQWLCSACGGWCPCRLIFRFAGCSAPLPACCEAGISHSTPLTTNCNTLQPQTAWSAWWPRCSPLAMSRPRTRAASCGKPLGT